MEYLLAPAEAQAGSDTNHICADNDEFVIKKLDSEERVEICGNYGNKVVLVVDTTR